MPEMNISKAQFGNTSWNPFSAASRGIEKLGAAATTAVTNSALGQQIHAQQQAAHEAHVAASTAQIDHEKWKTLAGHVLGQEAAENEQKRRLEYFTHTTKHAESGTPVGITTGDYEASFTKKTRKAAVATPTSTGTPVHIMKNPNTPTSEASVAPASKPKMYAYNHPVTGRLAYSETPGGPQGTAKKATAKKAAPKKRK